MKGESSNLSPAIYPNSSCDGDFSTEIRLLYAAPFEINPVLVSKPRPMCELDGNIKPPGCSER
jgi:hypothetical protein